MRRIILIPEDFGELQSGLFKGFVLLDDLVSD